MRRVRLESESVYLLVSLEQVHCILLRHREAIWVRGRFIMVTFGFKLDLNPLIRCGVPCRKALFFFLRYIDQKGMLLH